MITFINITRDGALLIIDAPFQEDFNTRLKRIGGTWNAEREAWVVADTSENQKALYFALQQAFSLQRAKGPLGEFVIGGF
jgi:hypothetical protein